MKPGASPPPRLPDGKSRGGVGYVLRKFPVLSETFILNELLALEALGVPLYIFSLERPNDPRFHEDLPKLKARVAYVPDSMGKLVRHHNRVKKYFKKRYNAALRYALASAKPKLFWRFLQSGYVANEARRLHLAHLHAHFANRPASVALLASKIAGIPFSFTAHAMDIFKSEVRSKALQRKIREARAVVTVSEYNKAYLEKLTSAARTKVVRIYNGIRLDRFIPNGVPPPEPFTILCVARLVEKKGLDILVEACHRLAERELSFRCWIVGKGRMRQQLDRQIKTSKLRRHVQLLGPHTQEEVLERYRAASLVVLPCVEGPDGNRDGLPVSIIEALACGLPVVTTPMTGIPEVVRHDHNGLLVPPGDAGALAAAIESVIRHPDLRARLAANARPSVEASFDLRETVLELRRVVAGGEP
jgi:glycosyltransferase involved in cell wall biosynthesis